jgi:hypothetical protein
MLRSRVPFRGLGMSRGMETEDEGEVVREEKARRIVTPIYPHDPAFNHAVRPQTAKLARDRLLDLLRDQRYHQACELEELLPEGAWVGAMKDLLALRYAFDRVDNHIRIRFREDREHRQVLVELLSGLDATKPKATETPEATSQDERVGGVEEPEFNLGDELPTETEGRSNSEVMVISEPADALTLSVDESVTMTAAILAKKQSGKTYLGMVIAEEFLLAKDYQIPVVVIDPTGVWPGLRAFADGQPSPFQILVLGGRHGDLPITAKDGAKVAQIVNAVRPHPVIIDVSSLAPVEQHEFVGPFIDGLYSSELRSPLHLIIDEADEFAPQVLSKSSKHQKRCLDAIDRLVRRGRTKGIGTTMITQRCAVIAKNVLSQTGSLWFLNMDEPRDLIAVESRLNHGVTEQQKRECINQIPRLQPGFAYYIQTGVSPKFRRFKVRRKKTFDSSKTPSLRGFTAPVFAKPPADALNIAADILKTVLKGEPSTGVESSSSGDDE